MTMKLSVISTKMAALPEVVEEDVNGILVPPNNANVLTEVIIKLIDDQSLRKSLGENTRKSVDERFYIKENIFKYIELIREQIKRVTKQELTSLS